MYEKLRLLMLVFRKVVFGQRDLILLHLTSVFQFGYQFTRNLFLLTRLRIKLRVELLENLRVGNLTLRNLTRRRLYLCVKPIFCVRITRKMRVFCQSCTLRITYPSYA